MAGNAFQHPKSDASIVWKHRRPVKRILKLPAVPPWRGRGCAHSRIELPIETEAGYRLLLMYRYGSVDKHQEHLLF